MHPRASGEATLYYGRRSYIIIVIMIIVIIIGHRPVPRPVVVHAQWSRYVSAKVNVVSLARRRVKLANANELINESGKPRERVHTGKNLYGLRETKEKSTRVHPTDREISTKSHSNRYRTFAGSW